MAPTHAMPSPVRQRPLPEASPPLPDLPPAATCMTLTESGLWVGTVKGLYVRPAGSRELVPITANPAGEPQVRCIHRAGPTMWVGFAAPFLRIFDVATFALLKELQCHAEGVQCLSGDRRMVFTGGADAQLRMWDAATYACLRTFTGHTDNVRCILSDGPLMYSGSDDCMVVVWDLAIGRQLRYLQGHNMGISSLVRTQNHLWSGSDDCTIKIWDVETGACLNTLEYQAGPILSMLLLGGAVWAATVDGITLWSEDGSPAGDCPIKGRGALKDLQSVMWTQAYKVLVARDSGIEVWNHTVDCHGADFSVQGFPRMLLKTVGHLQEQLIAVTEETQSATALKQKAEGELERLEAVTEAQREQIERLEQEVQELGQQVQLIQEDNGRLLLENDRLREALANGNDQKKRPSPHIAVPEWPTPMYYAAAKGLSSESDDLDVSPGHSTSAGTSRDCETATYKELNHKFQELLLKKEDLEDNVRELEKMLRTKWDEVQELSHLVVQRDSAVTSLKGIIQKQDHEKQLLIAKLDSLEAVLKTLNYRPAPTLEPTPRASDLDYDAGFPRGRIDRQPDPDDRKAMSAGAKEFVIRSRNQFVRAVHQLWETVSATEKVAGAAIDVVRNMIFTIHNPDELKDNEDTIRQLYAPLFQLLDLVRVSHHQMRHILSTYLTDVERLTLGLPAKGFELKMTKADLLDVEEEISQLHAQYSVQGLRQLNDIDHGSRRDPSPKHSTPDPFGPWRSPTPDEYAAAHRGRVSR